MADRSDAERFAEALDRLLEGEPVDVDDQELASLLEVARRLQELTPVAEPDPDFQARLRQELLAGQMRNPLSQRERVRVRVRAVQGAASLLRRGSRWQRSWGLRAASVALVLVAATLWLSLWPKGEDTLNGDLARLPSLLDVASAYAEQLGEDTGGVRSVIGDALFRLATPLPRAPERARVYRQVREPADEAGARDLARRLGIDGASVADDPDYGVFVVAGEGGRLVVSKAFRGYFSFEAGDGGTGRPGDGEAYSSSPRPPVPLSPPAPALAPPGAVVTPAPEAAEATRAAEEFLGDRGLLAFDYIAEVVDDAPPGATPLYRQVSLVPTVEGRPVRGLGIVATVGPGGKVTALQSAYAKLVPGREYPLLTPEEAYGQLAEKRPELFQLRVRKGTRGAGFSSGVSSVLRSAGAPREEMAPPPYQVGQTVELEGLLSAIGFEARDGRRRFEATLLVGPREARTRVQFKLTGVMVEDLAQLDQQHVRVWGRVEALSTRPSGGRLRVDRYEKLYAQERLVALLGRLEIEEERDEQTLVLVADDGEKYTLERPAGAPPPREYRGRRAIVEGRTTDRTSRAGYPVIELAGIQSGTDIDRRSDLSGYRTQRPQVVPEREPLLTGEVAVTRAALEYYATAAAGLPPRFASSNLEPFLLVQPIYSFSGSFEEGKGSFETYLQAVRPEHVEGLQ